MPLVINLEENALFKRGEKKGEKRGEKKGEKKKTKLAATNMLDKGMPIRDIAEILEISIDDVIKIQNELKEK